VAGWIIWYDDGSSFSSDDGEPAAAPRDGVQVVTCADIGSGRLIWHGSDFYCWQDDEWVPRSLLGLMDYLREPGAAKIVLQARAIAYRRFTEVYLMAVADERLPAKTGPDPREPQDPSL
jgi:hypothetical protein